MHRLVAALSAVVVASCDRASSTSSEQASGVTMARSDVDTVQAALAPRPSPAPAISSFMILPREGAGGRSSGASAATYILTARNAAGPTPPPIAVSVDRVDITKFRRDVATVADWGPAVDEAVIAAAGRPVWFPPGTYRIASARTLRRDTMLVGDGATLLFDFVGIGLTGTAVRFEARGITFDGNGKATTLVRLYQSSFSVDHCIFKRTHNASGVAAGFWALGCTGGRIRRSTFSAIRSAANGDIGDLPGVARGILLSRSTEVIVEDNTFTDIHSVDRNGELTMEDADAVHVAGGGYSKVLVRGNDFTNVGKRGIKFQCDGATARDNHITSTWSSPAKVMFAGISAFGNEITLAGNSILGRHYQFGIDLAAAGSKNVIVEGNTVDDSATFGEVGPFGQRSGIFANGQNGLRISGNRISNFRNGILLRGGTNVALSGNIITGVVAGTYVDDGGIAGVTVTENRIVGRANATGSIGSFFSSGSRGVASGNSYQTVQDGVYVAGKAAVDVAPDNVFADIGRKNIHRRAAETP